MRILYTFLVPLEQPSYLKGTLNLLVALLVPSSTKFSDRLTLGQPVVHTSVLGGYAAQGKGSENSNNGRLEHHDVEVLERVN